MQKLQIINIISAILILTAINTAYAQGGGAVKLLGLSVEGHMNTDAGLIIATSSLVVGQTLSGEKIQSAIRLLWQLELFSDIKILVEESTAEGAFLQIRVREYRRLELIDIGGGKKIGKKDLEETIDLHKGQVIKLSDPVRLKRKIRDLCEEKGYLLADIKVEIQDGSSDGLAVLYVRVDEGKKVKIKKIRYHGNEAYSDRKLRKKLKDTKQKAIFRSGEFHPDKFEDDKNNLIAFYRENGYRDAQVLRDSVSYSEDRKRMFLHVFIDEGSKYYFGNITFSGSDLFTEDELKRQLLFSPGDAFNQMKYEVTYKERLSTLFYDLGYIYTQVRPTETLIGADTLDIDFFIEPGNRFSVRQIHITGNTKTREKVIRREFVLKPGDTFDVTKLRRSIREVTILNYFANVIPDVEEVSSAEVDLWVSVEEKPTDQANLSAGYSQRDGLIGAVGFAAPNLFGTGQQMNFDWNFGQAYGSFSISYTEPWLFDTETLIGGSFYHVRRRWVDGFSENLIGGSIRLGRRFTWPDDYFRGDWIYRNERTRYTNFSESFKARNERGIQEGDIRLSSTITQIITRDSRDYPEFPTSGSVVSLTSELAGGPLTGDDKYHKHIVSIEWYTPLISKLVLYNELLYGFLAGLTGDPNDIPLLEYFFMGGSGLSFGTPLRGYDERTVGPLASSGITALGGKSQLKAALELRLQMISNPTIYALAFAEAGNTFLNFDQTDPFNLNRSVGFGVRLYMPLIGLIGLDFGWGFDHPDRYGRRRGRWIPHFQFGRQF